MGRGTKPVTEAGRRASRWAKEWFGVNDEGIPEADVAVDIEFDTGDPASVCKRKHRGNYGRLLCYVFKDGVHYNVVNDRYAGQGRGYVVVTGEASRHPDNDDGKPQIVLADAAQLSDLHWG